ncbi:MAG: 30S ribosomal protein S8 [SAR202 cluster bacterium Casp-Chloro-G4]|nr:30S ribosomal protein S8 [Chloroflexota bacterium]MDA1228277.1 30S ribosomal protein S8 [Chloroflexota bacterium]PKB61379.1 MAG: 30S ribosomal protein S8 [SAR202 cluster bacterium Casp-Chloro-G4]
MPVTDPISDMLTRIRNAIMVNHESVSVPLSKMKESIAKIFLDEGFIEGFEVHRRGTPQANIRIYLHYRGREESAIAGLRRVSKPGLRVYVKKGEIPRPYGGLGLTVLSTSKGVMTGRSAWREGIGGELLCYVW